MSPVDPSIRDPIASKLADSNAKELAFELNNFHRDVYDASDHFSKDIRTILNNDQISQLRDRLTGLEHVFHRSNLDQFEMFEFYNILYDYVVNNKLQKE
jgi:hypothetical protein